MIHKHWRQMHQMEWSSNMRTLRQRYQLPLYTHTWECHTSKEKVCSLNECMPVDEFALNECLVFSTRETKKKRAQWLHQHEFPKPKRKNQTERPGIRTDSKKKGLCKMYPSERFTLRLANTHWRLDWCRTRSLLLRYKFECMTSNSHMNCYYTLRLRMFVCVFFFVLFGSWLHWKIW